MAGRRLKISATATAQSFGDSAAKPGQKQDFIFQSDSASTHKVFIDCNGNTAIKDLGFYIAPGGSFTSKQLPEFMRQGPFSAVCNTGETATLYVTFAKTRG